MIRELTSRLLCVIPRHSANAPARLILCLLLASLTAGCGAGDDLARVGGLTTTIDTIAGVVQTMNRGSPPSWELREILTLGSAGGLGGEAGDDEFGSLTGVLADHAGSIYVADAQSYDIRVFSPEGRLLRRIGRQGAGPGEFGAVQSVGWIGDTLAVLDNGNGRLGLVRSDGEWAGHRPYMALTGDIRIHQTGPAEIYMPMIQHGDDGANLVHIRHLHAGVADTIPQPERPASSSAGSSVVCESEAAISFYSVDFAPKFIFRPAPGLLGANTWTAEYRIAFTDAMGDTVRIVERDLPPLPVTNEEWRAEMAKFEEWHERVRQYPGSSCDPSRPARPSARSTIREIFFDDVGNTWVERETTSGWAYDIFDPEGRLLAELPAPESRKVQVPPYVRDGRLHLIVTDEMDVEYVKVFEVVAPD